MYQRIINLVTMILTLPWMVLVWVFDIGYVARDAEEANVSNYSTDVFNSGINFGIPLNEYDRLRFNLDFRHTKLNTADDIDKGDEIL